MMYETNCTEITITRWKQLMRYARPCSYRLLVKRIKKEIPNLYNSLALEFPNPYAFQCRSTPTHYILVHSAIEYFIKKQQYSTLEKELKGQFKIRFLNKPSMYLNIQYSSFESSFYYFSLFHLYIFTSLYLFIFSTFFFPPPTPLLRNKLIICIFIPV